MMTETVEITVLSLKLQSLYCDPECKRIIPSG